MENNKQDSLNGHKERYNMKQIIRLTDQDLNNIIEESVKQIIKEIGDTPKGQYMLGRLSRKYQTTPSDRYYERLNDLYSYTFNKQVDKNMEKSYNKGMYDEYKKRG